jgi:hypothetical protein
VIDGGWFSVTTEDGAGIGAGYGFNGHSAVGSILIHNGTFVHIDASIGAAIGGGHGYNGDSTVTAVTVSAVSSI